MKTLLQFAVIAALCLPACAQTAWYTVSPENPDQSIVFPVGTTYRFGNIADNRWNPVVVSASTSPVLAYYTSQPADPDPNSGKVFQVLQKSVIQSIPLVIAFTRNGAGTLISTVTVPALPVVTPPTPTPPKPTPVVPISRTPCICTEFSDNHFECVATGPKTAVTK